MRPIGYIDRQTFDCWQYSVQIVSVLVLCSIYFLSSSASPLWFVWRCKQIFSVHNINFTAINLKVWSCTTVFCICSMSHRRSGVLSILILHKPRTYHKHVLQKIDDDKHSDESDSDCKTCHDSCCFIAKRDYQLVKKELQAVICIKRLAGKRVTVKNVYYNSIVDSDINIAERFYQEEDIALSLSVETVWGFRAALWFHLET